MSELPKVSRRKLSIFANAVEVPCVVAEITVDEVLTIKPDLSRKDAEEFLRNNAEVIATEMLAGAATAMFALLEGGRRAN